MRSVGFLGVFGVGSIVLRSTLHDKHNVHAFTRVEQARRDVKHEGVVLSFRLSPQP